MVGGWRLVTVCGRTRLRAYSYETQPRRRQQRVLEPTGEFPNGRKRDGNGGGGNCVRQDGSERGEARRRKRKRRCREEGPGRLDGEEEAWPVSQPRMQVRAILQQNTGWMENRSGGGQGPASQPASQTMGGAMSDGTGARAIWPGTARRERESARRPSVHPLREAYTFPRRDTPEAHGAICSEALRSAQCVSRQWTKAVVLWRTSPVSVCMGGTADRRDDMRHWSPRWSPLEPTGDGWWGCSARAAACNRGPIGPCLPGDAQGGTGRHREAVMGPTRGAHLGCIPGSRLPGQDRQFLGWMDASGTFRFGATVPAMCK